MSIKKLSKVRKADPFFAREIEKYEYPLPSREYVVQTLTEQGVPLGFDDLCELLDIGHHEFDVFSRRLRAMERDGDLMKNRKGAYILPEKVDLIAGKVEGHPDGYGFLKPDDKTDDLFLDNKQMDKVLHGDRALVRAVGFDRKGRREAVVVEVLERANNQVVGRVLVEHGVVFVVPENRRINQDILIPPEKKPRFKVQPGQVVVAEIIEQPTKFSQPIGRIVEILGNYADAGMEIEIALRKHDLPFEFSKAVLEETKRLPDKVKKTDWEGREDLRDLPLVTIDGETARDFDDAVYAQRQGRGKSAGWRLVVAIADVSHYVQPGMALDREAYERGNSVYFPRRVIPMLPEKLSNGLCSLNPDVDRLAMVCDMNISAEGEIKDYRFYPAVFVSRARLTYNQVWGWLSGEKKPDNELHESLQPQLKHLYTLFQALAAARTERGAIDFETTETMMLFNEDGKIDNIVPVVRNDAHRLIEECMLAANVCASDFLQARQQPCLYRVHEGPTPEKLTGLRDFLKEFGFGLDGGDDPHAKDYAALLNKIKPRPDAQLLQTVMLRSLRQAQYSPDNVGHFGLAYESYTHFTSPIRRYPDLLVHRAIKAALGKEKYVPHGNWDDIGLHCSGTERRADEATRDVENWLKCFYMKERIDEEFDGTIAAVVPFGVFVALDEVYVEGLVHVTELGQDYFQFDKTKHQMLGERTAQRYRLGDRLRVRLVKADLETGRIDFTLAEMPRKPKSGRGAEFAGERAGSSQKTGKGKPWEKSTGAAKPTGRTKSAGGAAASARSEKGSPRSAAPGGVKGGGKTGAKHAPKPAARSTEKKPVKHVTKAAPKRVAKAGVAAPKAAAKAEGGMFGKMGKAVAKLLGGKGKK